MYILFYPYGSSVILSYAYIPFFFWPLPIYVSPGILHVCSSGNHLEHIYQTHLNIYLTISKRSAINKYDQTSF